MIAGRFEKLGYVGTGIKAGDNETAQTVLLVAVRNFDQRYAGVFHPALQSIFAHKLRAFLTLIGIIIGVDRILDMCRTTLNVTGDLTAAVYVARSEGFPLMGETATSS